MLQKLYCVSVVLLPFFSAQVRRKATDWYLRLEMAPHALEALEIDCVDKTWRPWWKIQHLIFQLRFSAFPHSFSGPLSPGQLKVTEIAAVRG